jgi:hypothetical protein
MPLSNDDETIARDLTLKALEPAPGSAAGSLARQHGNDAAKLGAFVGEVYAKILASVKAANKG